MKRLIYLALGLSLIVANGSSKAEDGLNGQQEVKSTISQEKSQEGSEKTKLTTKQSTTNADDLLLGEGSVKNPDSTDSLGSNSQAGFSRSEANQEIVRTSNSNTWSFFNPILEASDNGLLGLLALLAVIFSSWRNKNATKKSIKRLENRVENLRSSSKTLVNPAIGNIDTDLINARLDELNARVRIIENKSKQISESITKSRLSSTTTPPMPLSETPLVAKQQAPRKEQLVRALNSGERQQFKDEAISQLNITSKSENDILIGRSTVTELEEVTGGGSYQLLIIDSEYLLFPTVLTLKGFTAAEKSKGIFDYEEQVISSPELVYPALLEQSGNKWNVKQTGKIYIPKI